MIINSSWERHKYRGQTCCCDLRNGQGTGAANDQVRPGVGGRHVFDEASDAATCGGAELQEYLVDELMPADQEEMGSVAGIIVAVAPATQSRT